MTHPAVRDLFQTIARHPAFQGVDFSSFVVQAQASKADVVGLANSSNDTVNAVKMANEFGVTPKQKLAALLMQISDIHGLTLDAICTSI